MSDAWIREIVIVDNFVDKDLRVDLTPAAGRPFRHLVLTGRNGCGKSSTLYGLNTACRSADWKGPPSAQPSPRPRRLAILGSRRSSKVDAVAGPTRDLEPRGLAGIEQMLVNWRVQRALAHESGDSVEPFDTLLRNFEMEFSKLVSPVSLSLRFVPTEFSYRVVVAGTESRFAHLPDGIVEVLRLWMEVWSLAWGDQPGVVLVDEPEVHLHAGLQERILPFLAATFPGVQFIVATHSAAIAASLDDALVFDLSKKRGWKSEDLHGWRYGRVLTEIFGLDDEYSQSVTAELHRLEALRDLSSRNASEEAEYRSLAGRLAGSSHAMALEIWLRLNDPRLSAAG